MTETTEKSRRNRLRWVAAALALVIAAGAVAWLFVERALHVDRYRPIIVKALEEATGLPVVTGPLDIDLLPLPHASLEDVQIGDDSLRLTTPEVVATVQPWSLLRKRLTISTITVSNPELNSAADLEATFERIQALPLFEPGAEEAVSKPSGPAVNILGARFPLEIVEVVVDDMDIRTEGGAVLATALNAIIGNVLEPAVTVQVESPLPRLGDKATLNGNATIQTRQTPVLEGQAKLTGVDLAFVADESDLSGALLTVSADFDAQDFQKIGGKLTGSVTEGIHPPVNGNFTADVWLDNGAFILNGITWTSPGTAVKGDFTYSPDGLIACQVSEAQLAGVLVAALVSDDSSSVALSASDGAQVTVADALFGTTADGGLRISKGGVSFAGFQVDARGGGPLWNGLEGKASVNEGIITVETLKGEGVLLSGHISAVPGQRALALDLSGQASITLDQFRAFANVEAIEDMGAELTIGRITGTFGAGSMPPEDLSADATLVDGHVTLRLTPSAEPYNVTGVSGNLRYDQGLLHLENVRSSVFSLSRATVTPDWNAGTARLDLAGTSPLDGALVSRFLSTGALSGLTGTLSVDPLTCTLGGEVAGNDLTTKGTVQADALTVTSGTFAELFTAVHAPFEATLSGIKGEIRANNAKLGALRFQGGYTMEGHTLEGTLTCDLGLIDQILPPAAGGSPLLVSWLKAYGPSSVNLTIWIAPPPTHSLSIHAVRQGEPKADVTVTLSSASGTGWTVDSVKGAADVPLAALSPLVPEGVTLEGTAGVSVQRATGAETFSVQAELTTAALGWRGSVRKLAGDPCSAELTGTAGTQGWTPQFLVVHYGGQEIPLKLDGGRVRSDVMTLDIGGFASLFPEGMRAAGRITGSFTSNPVSLDMAFSEASFAFGPALVLDRLDGDVSYKDGQWSCNNLNVRGANSEFTLAGAKSPEGWKGTLKGTQVDLNALLAMRESFSAPPAPADGGTPAAPVEAPAQPPSPVAAPFTTELAIDIGTLLYRRARIEQARAHALLNPLGLHIRDLHCIPHGGTLQGTLSIASDAPAAPQSLSAQFTFNGVEVKFLDDLVFQEPRNFSGLLTGECAFSGPWGTAQTILSGGNGNATFTGEKGTFGQLGFATKLLTVLRTTELLSLRLPALKDEGLTYDVCNGVLDMQNGIMTVREFKMRRPSYSLEAQGTVNFPQDQTDIHVRVNLMQTVKSITQFVPILGDATAQLTGMSFHVKGSPFNADVKPERTDRIGGATRKTEDATRTIIEGAIGSILR